MEYVFYTNLPSRIISIFLLFVALWFALPLELAVACVSLENVLWFVLLGIISLRFFTLRIGLLSMPLMWQLFWAALPLFAYNFFNVLYLSLDVIMIEYYMGEEAVAPYAYASLLMEGVILLVSSYFVAVYPTLSRLYVSDMDAYRRLFRQSFIMLFMFTVPTSVALGFWSDLWMNIIKDTGVISGKVLSVLAVNLNISMLNTFLFIVFTSCNRQRLLVMFLTVAVTVSFCSNCYLIPMYGQQGAAWATLFSMSFLFLILAPAATRLFSLRFPWKKPLWLLGISVISAMAAKWIPGLPVLVQPVLFTLLLAGLGWATGIMSKEEYQKILTVLRSKKEMK
jgi:O-antigen/teichoic acid export membrane protein